MTFLDTSAIDPIEPLPDWPGRFFNSENMTFGYYNTVEGAFLHEHNHPNEEIWHIIDGELEVTIGGENRKVGPVCVAMVPPDTLHSVKVISAGRGIVVDRPRRESIGGVQTS